MRLKLEQRPILGRRAAIGLGASLLGAAVAGLVIQRQPASQASTQLHQAEANRGVTETDQLIWGYQELARNNPKNADVRAILGSAYLQQARETGDPTYYQKAEQVIQEALQLQPEHIDALITKGTLALARHQFRSALAIGEQLRQIAPFVQAIYGVLADAEIELGMYEEAHTSIQTMVDMRPDLSSYTRVSYLRELHGDLDGAIQAMQFALNAGGPVVEHLEWTSVQLGNLYFSRGDLSSSEQYYLAALKQNQNYVYGLAALAHVRAAQGSLNQAIELYSNAIKRNPLPEFVIALGELQETAGQLPQAKQQYQLVRAMQQLFRANGVDTDLELALFEADHGTDKQAALTMAEAAYQQRPSVKGDDTLGWALYQAGKSDAARPYAERALRLGSKDASFLYHAGMIAKAQGDINAAKGFLKRSIAQNPNFSPLAAPQIYAALSELT